ncbi:MAG: mevalonate kinase [Methanobacteriales archaeon]
MGSKASAPGKAILFGEHAVVYGKPAIALAIDKRATITIKESHRDYTRIKSDDLDLEAILSPETGLKLKKGEMGILNYILKALEFYHDSTPINIKLKISIPIGAGLGSSAAVTVATIAALDNYHKRKSTLPSIARRAHRVELEVQGAASPLDTSISTHGGLIYLDKEKIEQIKGDLKDSLVIGYTRSEETAKMVKLVKERMERHPQIMNLIMDAIAHITRKARKALKSDDKECLGELMNINQGLLDAIGVNSKSLSEMIYTSREAGALGSKITGAGGGGSIIAYSHPDRTDQILESLTARGYNAMKANPSTRGVLIQ